MRQKCFSVIVACALTLGSIPNAFGDSQKASDNGSKAKGNDKMGHVLLISIDGMHALDFQNCSAMGLCPNMEALAKRGTTFTRASTSKPSDSFPGLMNIVTGATPKTHGAFYDVAYDRILAPPSADTGNGLIHGNCIKNQYNGTRTEFEEGVDIDQSKLNGGDPNVGPYDGGIGAIDPTKLPRDPFNNCAPVYPWNFIRTNTIYGVIHAAGGYTAWSDKHAVYAVVSGPSNNASNVDDYFAPEVNSDVVPLPGVLTATGWSCANIRDNNGGDWTTSFQNIQCYDTLKVNAILNQIDGKTHDGKHSAPVPNVFGMNFQSVSVGQKLIESGVKGGYIDAAGTPTTAMADELTFVDASIGAMVNELKKQGLLDKTTIIITAKHGQSPIDTNRFFPIPGSAGTNGMPPSAVIASYLPASETTDPIGSTEDDISLLWLNHSSDTLAAVQKLEAAGATAGIGQIFYGPSITTMHNSPMFDSRTPDIIVQPNVGVVYTGSKKKQAEHGGFAQDDVNVMLLVSRPDMQAKTITTAVETTQVAPTILTILGLDPSKLDGVQKEGTQALPGLN